SSSLIVRSPTRALSLSTSSSAAVLSRDFRPAWPAARNSSRHRESVAAVTPSSRESSSRASPRRGRRTASALRLEENRPRSFPDFCFPIGTPFRGHHAAGGCPRKSWCGRRDECLNLHWFIDLSDAREKLRAWREDYNHERPHSALGNLTPVEFANQFNMLTL